VFVHGAPGNAGVWAPFQVRAGAFARTVAFDLPGYGHADRPADADYSPGFNARFIGAAIAALGIERAHLVMNDLGSHALVWAAEHPQKVASTVQINTGLINSMRRWHFVGVAYRLPALGYLAELFGRIGLGLILRLCDVLPREVIRRWGDEFDRAQRRAFRRMYLSTPTTSGRYLVPILRDLDLPSLTIWGGRDRFTPVAQAEVQRQAFPSSRIVILDRSGHYPHVDDPEGVALHLLPFLQAQLGVATGL
jgi:pimeloyl-ACP methyl ester carboxylesterase